MRSGATRGVRWAGLVGLIGVLACSDASGPLDAVGGRTDVEQWGHVGWAAEGATIQCISPEDYATVQLPSGSDSIALELVWSTDAEAELLSGALTVGWYDTGSAMLGTVDAVAPITVDLAPGEHLLTLALLDEAGPLGSPGSYCNVQIRVTQTCFDDSDCDDPFFCNQTACEPGSGGELPTCGFGPPPVAGCCVSDFECGPGAWCNDETHTCEGCAEDIHCDDGNACTLDLCTTGVCTHELTSPDCCDCSIVDASPVETQCQGVGTCVDATCACDTNSCVYSEVETPAGKCCETGDHLSCDDGDPCTQDVCVANACRNNEILEGASQCCNTDTDCLDGNVCTVDSCDVGNSTCQYEPVTDAACCNSDEQCDDGDPTTWDNCNTWQCVHTQNVGYCTLPETSTVVIHELMINPGAVADADGEWVELHNQAEEALDLSGWRLSQVGSDGANGTLSATEGSSLIVPAGGYIVLCRNGNPDTNGGIACQAEYDANYELANDGDSVVLLDPTGALHDEVNYDGGPNFPNPVAASIALINTAKDNDVGAAWKASFAPLADSTDKGTPGGANLDVFALFEVAKCHESPLDDVCTTDTCVDNACNHVSVEGCCNLASDCVLPSPCHQAECVANQCQLTVVPAPDCCMADAECDDGEACSLDRCIGNACRYVNHPGLVGAACCNADEDCGSVNNECVVAQCDVDSNICLPLQLVGGADCCTQNSYPDPAQGGECDDGDPSTTDSCKDYQCLSIADPTYCDTQVGEVGTNNCHLDGNPCTGDQCNLETSTCIQNPIPGCCGNNTDCFDGNPCTLDACDLSTGTCSFDWEPGCCFASQASTHCDDENLCTTDTCGDLQALEGSPGEFYGRCRNVKSDPSCCAVDADCGDGDACTLDVCNVTDQSCAHTPVVVGPGETCCDPASSTASVTEQCEDSNACTLANCVNNLCVQEAIPDDPQGACCDLEAPGAETESVQCDDSSACTLDRCIFGRCRHLVADGTDCCSEDADCDDGDPCTTDSCGEVAGNQVCVQTPIQCDDGVFCNGLEVCDAALGCVAQPGSEPNLEDGVSCTVGVCDEAADAVVQFPNDVLCDDGAFCNGAESCDADEGCLDGTPPSPVDDEIACTTQVCSDALGDFEIVPNHALCDDQVACNGQEQCQAGVGCVPGEATVDLDDGIACTVDVCDDAGSGEVQHLPDDGLCDDGLVCTTDACDLNIGCLNTAVSGVCVIAQICYGPGTNNPENSCLV